MKKNTNSYQTKDLNLVISAKTAGVGIEFSEKDKNGNVIWYLVRSELLDRVIDKYFAGTLSLPVQQLFYNQRLIKSQLSANN